MNSTPTKSTPTKSALLKSQIPNLLTWLRIVLIPVLVVVFLSDLEYKRPLSGIIFAIAGISDGLDGYLARRWGQTSTFGAFLDPVADKLLVSSALVLIVSYDQNLWIVLSAIIIIGREIAVSALREWMTGLGLRNAVRVRFIGKFKTGFQITAMIALLYQFPFLFIPMYQLGFYTLLIAAILTLVSMSMYLQAAWEAVQKNKH